MNSHNSSRKTSIPVLRLTRLLDQLREQIRYLHYSLSTEKVYLHWVKFFTLWHGRDATGIRYPTFACDRASRA